LKGRGYVFAVFFLLQRGKGLLREIRDIYTSLMALKIGRLARRGDLLVKKKAAPSHRR